MEALALKLNMYVTFGTFGLTSFPDNKKLINNMYKLNFFSCTLKYIKDKNHYINIFKLLISIAGMSISTIRGPDRLISVTIAGTSISPIGGPLTFNGSYFLKLQVYIF